MMTNVPTRWRSISHHEWVSRCATRNRAASNRNYHSDKNSAVWSDKNTKELADQLKLYHHTFSPRNTAQHVHWPCWGITDFSYARPFEFPRTNSPYGELSFPILFVSRNFRSLGTKVSWNFRSRALSFSGTFVPGEPSFPGLFVPRNFRSSDYFTNHWLWMQTAIATVRICFVVGLVVFVFQK